MKTLATPLGLAGLGSNPEAERRHAQFFNWRVAGTALLVALAYYLGAKIGFALTLGPIRFRFFGRLIRYCWPRSFSRRCVFGGYFAGGISGASGGANAKQRPAHMILCWFISNSCEALIGAGCVRYLIVVRFGWIVWATSEFYCLFAVFLGTFPFFLFGCGLRRHESLGRRQLLGGLANPIYLQHFGRADPCALDRDLGAEELPGFAKTFVSARFVEGTFFWWVCFRLTPSFSINWDQPQTRRCSICHCHF